MKRFVVIIVVVMVLGAAGFGAYGYVQSKSGASATETGSYTHSATASTGSLRATVTVVGELASLRSADLAFEEMSGSAPLLGLKVAAGNTVKAGDVLATIESAGYRQAVDQAESAYQAAVATLAELGEPVTELQDAEAGLAIARAELQIRQAQSTLDELLNPDLDTLQSKVADAADSLTKAQANLLGIRNDETVTDKLEDLKETESEATVEHGRLVSESYDDAYHQDRVLVAFNRMKNAEDARVSAELQSQINLLKAQGDEWQAQQNLAAAQENLVDARTLDPVKEAEARLAVKKAEIALAQAQSDRAALDEGADETDLAAARADVDKKQLALEDAQAALDGAQLVAPFDGTILQTNVTEGDDIAATTTILTLADLSQLQVITSIDETTIKRIARSQPATVTFDALPGTTLTGGVGEVPLQGALSGGVMIYEVPITLQGAENLPLLTGMTANVVIATGSVENALLIPSMALTKSSGMYYVQVPNTVDPSAEPESVPVEVGLSDGVYTQVVRGLVEGDQVLVTVSSGTDSDTFRAMRVMMGGFGR